MFIITRKPTKSIKLASNGSVNGSVEPLTEPLDRLFKKSLNLK